MGLSFAVQQVDGEARRGRLVTPHGVVETPTFMPVGTLGAVKGLTARSLAETGAQVMLANLYHLSLRPGIEVIEGLGGLHAFTGWRGPILTDSGGYQVWSLARLRRVDDDGVTFRSHVDGDRMRFTPAGVVEAQLRLGVDIAMVLDECPPWPIAKDDAETSLARTNRWAAAARRAWERGIDAGVGGGTPGGGTPGGGIPGGGTPGGLFGIVQGSVFPDLRSRAVDELAALDFDGYAIGGVSVGEDQRLRREVVTWCAPRLPAARPRYLMGLGTPLDLLHAVRAGVDLFDCVLPARSARHGLLFTRDGVVRIKNARFRTDPRPLDEACGCPLCRDHSRAFLHHLARTRELSGAVLGTLHNVRFYLDFMQDLREGIELGTLSRRAVEIARRYSGGGATATR